jgi:hypothetical protein
MSFKNYRYVFGVLPVKLIQFLPKKHKNLTQYSDMDI